MRKSALFLGAAMLPATAAMAAAGGNDSASSNSNMSKTPISSPSSQRQGDSAVEPEQSSSTYQFKRNLEHYLTSVDQTNGPGYTYAQGEYIPQGSIHNKGGHDDFTGYGGDVSLAFPTHSDLPVHPILQGGWHRLNVDHSSMGFNQSYIGLGGETFYDYGGAEGTGIGFYGTVNYERLQARHVGANKASPTADGWGITTGLRWMAMPQVEVNPHATYSDYGSLASNGTDWGSPEGFQYGMQLVGYLDQDQHTALTVGYDRSDMGIGPQDYEFHNKVNVGARFTF